MLITWKIMKSILFFLLVSILLILAVLFPRSPDIAVQGRAMTLEYGYEFSWEAYKHNISMFLHDVKENKTLGFTRYNNPAEEEIWLHMARSLKVILAAFFITLTFGVLKGIYDFYDRWSGWNVFGKGMTWLLQSIPDFFLIICLQWLIIFYLPFIRIFGHDHWYSFILPAFLVSMYPMLYIARITSASLGSEKGKPYIQVARSKGLSKEKVLWKHMLRNSLYPIFSNLTAMMLYLLSNLLIVEYLLDYRGAAYRMFQAFDVSKAISGGMNLINESGLIIGFGLCFMIIVFISQIITLLVIKKVEPR
ncbi:ABC transporter permease subunit [Sutcliffiella halmapala]|uniref:ABC transporter permease subunit n=1 Tax=Sutcliffiella halmapala TaxID=79882 RepID=UPI00147335C3|nr:ABC transporter permease [Sutcliffiella halmapala]